ncbi:hypothetical protein CR513_26563, partial [Mucuna pruriens]
MNRMRSKNWIEKLELRETKDFLEYRAAINSCRAFEARPKQNHRRKYPRIMLVPTPTSRTSQITKLTLRSAHFISVAFPKISCPNRFRHPMPNQPYPSKVSWRFPRKMLVATPIKAKLISEPYWSSRFQLHIPNSSLKGTRLQASFQSAIPRRDLGRNT